MNVAASPAERRLARLRELEPAQGHVRRRFGLPEQDDAAMVRVAERYTPPAWAAGSISMYDAMFLYDLVRGVKPDRVLEIGVASGGSSLLLLSALADAGVGPMHHDGEPTLQSFEIHPMCYFDRSKPVGCVVHEQAPELLGGWKLHVRGTAREAGKMFAKRCVKLAFIDADHRHPAPTADLIWLLPALADGAWVVLHDIDLPNVAKAHEERTGEKVTWHDRGAKELFDGWPWEKIRGGAGKASPVRGHDEIGASNIGAIRVPAGARRKDLNHIIEKAWETDNEDLRAVLR